MTAVPGDARLTDAEREALAYAALLDVNDDVMTALAATAEAILSDRLPEATTVTEWGVRHPGGVEEKRVPESLARRNVQQHPDHILIRRQVTRTADHVGPWEPVEVTE